MQNPNFTKLNVSVRTDVAEAIDRERQAQGMTRSGFIDAFMWYALVATPEQIDVLDNFVEQTAISEQ